MKKYCLIFFAWCLSVTALEVFPEVKVGYFIPTDAQFRNTYSEDGVLPSIEASVRAWNRFFPWASVGYFSKWGHTHSPRESTHLYFVPIGVGLKYIYSFSRLSVYGGAGALPTYLHINRPQLEKRWGCGGIVKAGVIADRLWGCFVDFFAEYSYLEISTGRGASLHPANLSNFTIGGGIGYHFGGPFIECDD